jgi:hypothetical protein
MNARLTLALLSLSAAGLFAAWVALRPRALPVPTSAAASDAVADLRDPTARRTTVRSAAAVEDEPFQWSRLESEDYRAYIANLRAIGCPETTLRDIIVADVNKLFAGQEAAWRGSEQDGAAGAPAEPAAQELERRTKLRELLAEKRSLLRELLGPDVPVDILPSTGRCLRNGSQEFTGRQTQRGANVARAILAAIRRAQSAPYQPTIRRICARV